MENKRKIGLFALTMAVTMALSALPVNIVFAEAVEANKGLGTSGVTDNKPQGDTFLGSISGNVPEGKPEAPMCDCTSLCTVKKIKDDCPVCKEGFDKCGYVENTEMAVILEKTSELLAWFDSRMEPVLVESPGDAASMPLGPDNGFGVGVGMTIRGKDGYILTEEDKAYFLDCYGEIMALMDALMESDFSAYERVTDNADFRRLHGIAQVVGGYAGVPLAAGGTYLANGQPFIMNDGDEWQNVYGGGGSNTTFASTDITINGGAITNILSGGGGGDVNYNGSQITGNSLITINGGTIGSVYGGGNWGADTHGDIKMNISGGTIGRVVAGGDKANSTVGGKIEVYISGGRITGEVSRGQGGQTNTVYLSGKPRIGTSGVANSGIKVEEFTKIIINGKLEPAATIMLVAPNATQSTNPVAHGTILAEATDESFFTANSFFGVPCYKDGKYLRYGYYPTAGTKQIFANGIPLVIEGAATATTVYIDANRNGTKDSGELSLKAANVLNAPNDGIDLSGYTIYAGSGNRVRTVDPMITMNGGRVLSIYGGGKSAAGGQSANTTGKSIITINSGATVVDSIYGGGHDTWATGARVTNSEITVGGTVGGTIYGGGYASYNENTNSTPKVQMTSAAITLKAGGTANIIYGGGRIAGPDGAANVNADAGVDTAAINVYGTVNGPVYGGGCVEGTSGGGSTNVGTVNINIYSGGKVNALWGGGSRSLNALQTTANVATANINIYGGEAGYVYVNGQSNGSSGNTAKVENATITISGGSMKRVTGEWHSGTLGTATLNIKGNPVINTEGVDLTNFAGKKVNITGALTSGASILIKSGMAVGSIVATASAGVSANDSAAYFTTADAGGFFAVNGQNIVLAAKPEADASKNIYGNGAALIIEGSDDARTTVYIDTNRNGMKDTGELSLQEAGVTNAPNNGSDLSAWSVFGGSTSKLVTGDTQITMNGGKVRQIFGAGTGTNGAVSGSSYITVNGGTVTDTVYAGSAVGYLVNVDAIVNINGGMVGTVSLSGSVANAAIKRNAIANITGGTIRGSVIAPYTLTDTTTTVNISGNPKIGNKTNLGISLNHTKDKKITINGTLTGSAGDITLVNPTSGVADTIVATATNADYADSSKFVMPSVVLYADGVNIRIGNASKPTVGKSQYGKSIVSGNGSALLVAAGTTPGTTTIYWDKNRNGQKDSGELSLKGENITGAPEDSSDLSTWSVYGGGTFTKGDTLVTMTGGKVYEVIGNSENTALTGNTYIDIKGSAAVGDIYGNSDKFDVSSKLTGNTYVSIGGNAQVMLNEEGSQTYYGRVSSGGGIVKGSTNVTVDGDANVDWITGASLIATTAAGEVDVTGNSTITITGGTVNNIVGTRAVSGGPGTINGNFTVHASSGTIGSIDALESASIKGAKTVCLSGSPKIGNQMTKGINLRSLTDKKVTIKGSLTGEAGDITLQSTGISAGTTVASADNADWADASKFTSTEVGKIIKKNGADLVAASVELPTIITNLESGHNGIFGNGHALVAVGTSPSSATVYIDRNRNGTWESGEPSLSAAGVAGAPADGADLSSWILSGGWHRTSNSGDALVTVRSAKLYSVSAGNHKSLTDSGEENTLTGSATVNIYNSSVDYLYTNGSNGYLVGDATLTIQDGVFKKVMPGGWPNRITGKRTINISGNVKIGSAGKPNEGLDAVAVCYRGGGVSGTGDPVPGFHEDSKINIGSLTPDSKIYLQSQSNNTALKYNLPVGTVLAYPLPGTALDAARFETTNGSSLSIENGNLVLDALSAPAFSKLEIRNKTADGEVVVDLLDPAAAAGNWALDTESDYYLFAQLKTQEDYIQIRYGSSADTYNGVTFANPPGGSFTPDATSFTHDYFQKLEKFAEFENPPYGSSTGKLALRDGELLYRIKDNVANDADISFAVGIFVNDAIYDGKNSILNAISVSTGSYAGTTFTPITQKDIDLKISDKNKMRTNMAHTVATAELGGIGTTVQLNALVNVDTLQQVAVLYNSYTVDITYPKGATLEYGLNTSFLKTSSTYGTASLADAGTESTVDGITYVTRKLTIAKGYKPLGSSMVAYLRLDFPAGFATGKYDMTLTNPQITMPNGTTIIPETAGFNQRTTYTVAKGGNDGTTMTAVARPDIYNQTQIMDASDYLVNLGSAYIKNTSPGSASPHNKTYEVKFNTTNTAAEIRMITVPLGTFDTINTAPSGEANGLKVTVTGGTSSGTSSVTLSNEQLLAAANVPGDLTASTYLMIYAKDIGLTNITSVKAEIGKIRAGYVSSTNNSSWAFGSNQAGAFGSFTDGGNGTVVTSEFRLYNTDPALRDVTGGELIVPVTAISTLTPRMGMNGGNHFLTGIGEGGITVKRAALASDSAVPAGDTAVISGAIYPYVSRSAYTAPPTLYSGAMLMKDPVFYFTLPQGLDLDSSKIKFTLNTYNERGKSQGSKTITNWDLVQVEAGVYKIGLLGTTVGSYDDDGFSTQLGYELAFTTEKSLPTQRYRLNDLVTLATANQTEAMPYAGVNNATLVYAKPDTNHFNDGKTVFGITKDKDDTPMGFGVQQQADVVVTSAIAVSEIDGTAVTPEWASYSASNPNSIAMLGANSKGQIRLIIKNTSEIKGDNLRLLLPIPKKDADMGSVFMDIPQGFTMNMTNTPSSGSSGGFTVEYAKVSGSHDNMSNLFAAGGYTTTAEQDEANALLITAGSLAKGEYTLYFDYTVANGTVDASDIFRPAYAYTVVSDNRQNTGAYLASAVAGSKLTGIVFNDQDKNGVMDIGDTGAAGITVQARDARGRTETVTTDADGKYSFVAVRESAVTLTFTVKGSESMRFNVQPSTAAAGTVSTVTPSADGMSAACSVYASGDMSVNAAMSGFVTLSYDKNTATGGSLPADSEYSSGDTATVAVKPDNLVKTGYQFKEWNTLANGSGTGYQSGAAFTVSTDTKLYAIWEISQYTITFNYRGATGGNDEAFRVLQHNTRYGGGISGVYTNPLPAPTKTGYTFKGWTRTVTAATANVTDATKFTLGADTILYAIWAPKAIFAVKYDTKGGSAIADKTNVAWDGEVLPSATPARAGYTFDGWMCDGTRVTAETVFSDLASSDANGTAVTLTAMWRAKSGYTVKYDANGGSGTLFDKTNVSWSDVSLLPAHNPTKENFAFDGWILENTAQAVTAADSYGALAQADTVKTITLKAVWKEVSDNIVKYNSAGGTSINDKNGVKASDANLLPAAVPEKKGYVFDGWYVGASKVESSTVYSALTSERVLTLTAKWSAKSYTIQYDPGNGTTIADAAKSWLETGLLPAGALTKNGYTLDGWYYGNTRVTASTSVSSLIPADDKTELKLTARWIEKTYTVLYDTDGGNYIPPRTGVKYTAVNLLPDTAAVKPGYNITGWQSGGTAVTGSTPLSGLNPSGSTVTIQAQWTVKSGYKVIYDANGGVFAGDQTKANVSWTDKNLLPATAPTRDGYILTGWKSGRNTVTADTVFSVLAANDGVGTAVTLVAQWTEKADYKVKYESEFGTQIADKTGVKWNQRLLLPSETMVQDGWALTGWYFGTGTDKVKVTNTDAYSAFAAANDEYIVLTAGWEEKSDYIVHFDTGGGGSIPSRNTVLYETMTNLLPTEVPVKYGDTFEGWTFTRPNGQVVDVKNSMTYKDLAERDTVESITLKAKWSVKSFTVRYEENGGSEVEDRSLVLWTDSPIIPADASSKTGYNLAGWYYGDVLVTDSSTLGDICVDDSHAEIVLAAEWQENTYTITYNTDGGNVVASKTGISYTQDELLPASSPYKDGHTFAGWYYGDTEVVDGTPAVTNEDGAVTSPAVPGTACKDLLGEAASNITIVELKAKWTVNRGYIVEYDTGGAGYLPDKADVSWTEANLIPAADGLTKSGCTLTGWTHGTTPVTSATAFGILADSDLPGTRVVLTASWTENSSYTVKYDLKGGTQDGNSAMQDKTGVKWTQSGFLPSPNPVRNHYVFGGWVMGGNTVENDTPYSLLAGNADTVMEVTVAVKWMPIRENTVKYETGTGATVIADKTGVAWDDTGLLPANPAKPGCTFTGWKCGTADITAETKYSDCDNAVSKTITLAAQWTENSYTVVYDTAGGNTISDKTGVKWADCELLPATAPVREHYIFAGWAYNTTAVTAATKYSELAADDTVDTVTLAASWTDKPYTVKYNTDGGSALADKTVHWDKISLLADAVPMKKDAVFSHWTYGRVSVTADMSYKDLIGSAAMTEEITLTAVYTAPTEDTGGVEGSIVTDTENKPIENVLVSVHIGGTAGTKIAGPVKTGTDGKFSFYGLPYGVYTLVAARELPSGKMQVITKTITIGKDAANGDIIMPSGWKNTIVEIAPGTPAAAANGLDAMYKPGNVMAEPGEGVTQADHDTVTAGGSLEIKLLVAQKAADDAAIAGDMTKIKGAVGTNATIIPFDLSVLKTVVDSLGASTSTGLKKLPQLIEIIIPMPELNGKDIKVLRVHDGDLHTLPYEKDGITEGAEYKNGNLHLALRFFSTYAISYTTKGGAGDNGGGNGGGEQYYYVNLHAGEGGSFIPDTKRIKVRAGDSAGIDIVPSEGYTIGDVVVNGKSAGAVSAYLIRNIHEDYTISATFAKTAVPVNPVKPGAGGGTGEMPKPAKPGIGGGTDKTPKPAEDTTREYLDDLLRDLEDKRDAAIDSLPGSLTKAQRAELIDELNRIHDEAAEAIKNAKGVNEASELFNEAVRDFEEVLSRFGVIMPGGEPGDEPAAKKPFILVSALLALMAAILAALSLRKRKEDELKKHNRILTLSGAAGSIIIFLLTTGWSGVALANVWTLLVAVGTGIALYGFTVKKKK